MVDGTLAGAVDDALSARCRAVLPILTKVTLDHAAVTADDLRPALAAGVTRAALVEALNVGYLFNTITRLADTANAAGGPTWNSKVSASRVMVLNR